MTITEKIKHKGLELGFTNVGITTAEDFEEYGAELGGREDYAPWTDDDRAKYTGRSDMRKSSSPRAIYPKAKSIICATCGYGQYVYPQELTPYVARAYLCRSYVPTDDIQAGIRCNEFKKYIKSLGIEIYEGQYSLPERAACARAGITTYGKNNFAYTEQDGSFNILYTFIVDAELEYDVPTVRCDCPPNCNLCIEACPTQAILRPTRLHPQSCMLFNQQLAPGMFPQELWEKVGTSIHGCDICQTVCPRNKKVLEKANRKDMFLEKLKQNFDLEKVLVMEDEYYEDVVKPIMYNYIRDMDIFRRNAAIALGNTGDKSHLPALENAMKTLHNEEVKKAVQWAIDKLSKE